MVYGSARIAGGGSGGADGGGCTPIDSSWSMTAVSIINIDFEWQMVETYTEWVDADGNYYSDISYDFMEMTGVAAFSSAIENLTAGFSSMALFTSSLSSSNSGTSQNGLGTGGGRNNISSENPLKTGVNADKVPLDKGLKGSRLLKEGSANASKATKGGTGDGTGTFVNGAGSMSSWAMYQHYRNGGGDLTLEQMGLQNEVRNYPTTQEALGRFGNQISNKAETLASQLTPGTHDFKDSFERSYDFTGDKFAFGSATLSGDFKGTLNVGEDGSFSFSGSADIGFHDVFTDPYDTFDVIPGEWNPDGASYNIDGSWEQPYSGGR